MRSASKLTDSERSEIQILHTKGYSARSIALVLGRSPNTIAAELKRNSYREGGCTPPGKRGTYSASYAKQKAYRRRWHATYQGKKITTHVHLQAFIVEKLAAHWNPDEIAGYLKRHRSCATPCGMSGCSLGYASKTAIYAWLYTGPGQPYCRHLASQRSTRKRHPKRRTARVMISGRIGIERRPPVVARRTRFGDWEGDTIVSGRRTGSQTVLAVFQERSTRLVTARLLPNRQADGFAAAATASLEGHRAVTLTLDNGIENKHWQAIAAATGAKVYFCDPYSSWQKGSIEHANKMLRRYIPKGSDLRTLTQDQIDHFVAAINNKPRRCLGYRSALELCQQQARRMHAQREGVPTTEETPGVLFGG